MGHPVTALLCPYPYKIASDQVSDKIPETDEEEEMEVVATVQQTVSYFTSNNNKVCTVQYKTQCHKIVKTFAIFSLNVQLH